MSGYGCPKCNESKLEISVENALLNNNIDFIWQCGSKNGLKDLGRKRIDFFIPSLKIAIECQGEQHFKSNKLFGGEDLFIKRKRHDKDKLNACIKNGIKMIYYTEEKFIKKFSLKNTEKYEFITKVEDLIKKITGV